MKIASITVALLVTFATFSTKALASNESEKAFENLRKEIVQLVQKPELNINGIKEGEVQVRFMLNERHEVVLLSVSTDNIYLKNFIKERLDKKKIETSNIAPMMKYKITINFSSEL